MKAMTYNNYGPPEELQLEEVEKPIPKDNEILIKVHASSINSWDWDLLKGTPFMNRLFFGFLKPKYRILGCDVSGEVEAIGKDVERFQVGDQVFGDLSACGWGCFAEYVAAQENALLKKPENLSFEQSAAVPQAAVLALQGLTDKSQIQPGQTVLINGAGGGAGTFAVQMARASGAEVVGVDSGDKLDLILSLGAKQVIDYTKEDFTKNGKQYDLILDMVARRSISDYKRVLTPNGRFVMVGGSTSTILGAAFLAPVMTLGSGKAIGILLHKANKHLDKIKEMLESGQIKSVIDRSYPLDQLPEAMRQLGEGRVKGKVVINIGSG